MGILCLKVGSTTGYAIGARGHVVCGAWSLRTPWAREPVELLAKLYMLFVTYEPFEVFFDEGMHRKVCGARGKQLERLRSTVENWCTEREINSKAIRRGAYLKAFTGVGVCVPGGLRREALRRGLDITAIEAIEALAMFAYMTDGDNDALALLTTRVLPQESRAESAAFIRQMVLRHRIQTKVVPEGAGSWRDDPEGAMFRATLLTTPKSGS